MYINMKNKFMNFGLLEKTSNFVSKNGSTLSMVCGLITLAGALYAAFKASDDVVEANKDYVAEMEKVESEAITEPEKARKVKDIRIMRNLKYVYAYKWVILFGGSSAGFIFLTKYLDGLAISGLTALAWSQQEKLKKFAENAKEMLGEEKFKELEDKNLEDLILKNFVTSDGEPVVLKFKPGSGDIFADNELGVIFQISRKDLEDDIKWAEEYYHRNHELSYEKWWEHLGLPPRKDGKFRVWGPKNPFGATIEENKLHGITIPMVMFKNKPQPPDKAGLSLPWKESLTV